MKNEINLITLANHIPSEEEQFHTNGSDCKCHPSVHVDMSKPQVNILHKKMFNGKLFRK